MHMGDVKELLQPANGLDVLRVVNVMKFDVELIDLRERAVGGEQERVPLRAFDIDFHDERRCGVAVARELARKRVKRTAVLRGASGADALAVKHGLAARA